jgi:hypothetical protein
LSVIPFDEKIMHIVKQQVCAWARQQNQRAIINDRKNAADRKAPPAQPHVSLHC